jgi:hypothetical protein
MRVFSSVPNPFMALRIASAAPDMFTFDIWPGA